MNQINQEKVTLKMNTRILEKEKENIIPNDIINDKQKDTQLDKQEQPNKRAFGKEIKNISLRQRQKGLMEENNSSKSLVVNIKVKSTQPEKSLMLLEECEVKHLNNPQYLIEYAHEIIENVKMTEMINRPDYPNVLSRQKKINENSRRILIDWLVNVHDRFELLPETLFLAINLLDRVLEKMNIPIEQFQLLGVASMLIACKYEEIYSPEIRDFIYITGKSFTKVDILKMEGKILSLLDFDILSPSPYFFLNRFFFISCDDKQETFYITQLFLELNLMNPSILRHMPSLQAASMLYLSRKVQKYHPLWTVSLQMQTGYTEKDLKSLVQDFLGFYKNVFKGSRLDAILTSFSNENHLNVGKKFSN